VVWASSPYRGEALLLHLALADFANDEGVCWPSQRTLAKKARCSENYVRVAIKRMITDGLVEITEQSNGRGNSISYQLKPHSANAHSPNPHFVERETPLSTIATPLINRNEPSLAEEFNQFWEAYPRKVAKGTASKAFAKAFARNPGLKLETLLQSVKDYATTFTDIRYCAYPATWLNAERWADNLEAKSASVKVTDHQAARSFGAALRHTGRSEAELLSAISHYPEAQREAALNEYRSQS